MWGSEDAGDKKMAAGLCQCNICGGSYASGTVHSCLVSLRVEVEQLKQREQPPPQVVQGDGSSQKMEQLASLVAQLQSKVASLQAELQEVKQKQS
jgi:hypothetical protein